MTELFNVQNQVVIVTGGAGVLGGSIAEYLLKEGAKVVIISRSEHTVADKLEELKKISDNVLGFACDVLSESSLIFVKDEIIEKWGKIDALINAAGGNMPGATIGPDKNFFDLKMEDFRKVSELNLDGSVLPSMVFGKEIVANGKGSIINVSSMAAAQAITRVVGYSASKAAIDSFTKWLATEFALKFGGKIRVNAIAPGFFIGKQNLRLLTNEDGSYTDRGNTIISNTPMKRFGESEELNGTVHWLLSDAASFVTGIVVPIDGGFSAFSGV
ncbi:SDR family oxidoreductase [Wenyingzhuangia sp. 2_MG-2023]|uniref:SDR family oxidoreductase n=1 Tax=Wenyingzhuangia sp. 2_MG-2023 TaxID=3062639 RepID=UPI0026E16744|nr:SDR family oxidoreductase [Wenyingzhuangia sp. 2_MG-2023]MDO6737986.1 SDR family oxidoreductase [Wenyingzhuangia sp. 2_MG-2023]